MRVGYQTHGHFLVGIVKASDSSPVQIEMLVLSIAIDFRIGFAVFGHFQSVISYVKTAEICDILTESEIAIDGLRR